MMLEILCVPSFTTREAVELGNAASELGISKDVLIRNAVRYFSAECAPTQKAAKGQPLASLAECAPTPAAKGRRAAE